MPQRENASQRVQIPLQQKDFLAKSLLKSLHFVQLHCCGNMSIINWVVQFFLVCICCRWTPLIWMKRFKKYNLRLGVSSFVAFLSRWCRCQSHLLSFFQKLWLLLPTRSPAERNSKVSFKSFYHFLKSAIRAVTVACLWALKLFVFFCNQFLWLRKPNSLRDE